MAVPEFYFVILFELYDDSGVVVFILCYPVFVGVDVCVCDWDACFGSWWVDVVVDVGVCCHHIILFQLNSILLKVFIPIKLNIQDIKFDWILKGY